MCRLHPTRRVLLFVLVPADNVRSVGLLLSVSFNEQLQSLQVSMCNMS